MKQRVGPGFESLLGALAVLYYVTFPVIFGGHGYSAQEANQIKMPEIGSSRDLAIVFSMLDSKNPDIYGLFRQSADSFEWAQEAYYGKNPKLITEGLRAQFNEWLQTAQNHFQIDGAVEGLQLADKIEKCIDDGVSFKQCVESELGTTIPEEFKSYFRDDKPDRKEP